MKKVTLLVTTLLLSAVALGQGRRDDQFSLEASYGLGISGKPISTQFTTFGGGLRWMWNDDWGLKGDAARSTFRYNAPAPVKETGTDYNRLSLQIVHNLGRTLDLASYVDNINVLAHAGAGYSWMKPVNVPATDMTDSMGNIIFGFTPQVYISDRLSLNADWSYIVNLSQHKDYNGEVRYQDRLKRFTGGMSTFTVGLTVYLGRNGSDRDWR
ncbi:outer membrane beta-barrel protein [Flavobacterium sp. RNTU_13]|uniref:outer membrane beta-barrel protein n=1 Tax=Flavobacterium sp. RNTU_13 TaxID=3375145 RepID=UPI00398847CC